MVLELEDINGVQFNVNDLLSGNLIDSNKVGLHFMRRTRIVHKEVWDRFRRTYSEKEIREDNPNFDFGV